MPRVLQTVKPLKQTLLTIKKLKLRKFLQHCFLSSLSTIHICFGCVRLRAPILARVIPMRTLQISLKPWHSVYHGEHPEYKHIAYRIFRIFLVAKQAKGKWTVFYMTKYFNPIKYRLSVKHGHRITFSLTWHE